MRLQSHDEFAGVASIGPDAGDFLEVSRAEAGVLLDEPLSGHFSWSLGPLAVLFRYEGSLWFRVGDSEFLLEQTKFDWSSDGSNARLALVTPARSRLFEYSVAPLLEFDFTVFAEPEDFDFGLFVFNVAADAGRAARMYQRGTNT